MQLSSSDLGSYSKHGFLLLQNWLDDEVINAVRQEAVALAEKESDARVFEPGGRAVRAIHGCHLENEVMQRLVRHPKLLQPAIQILQSDVYVYQFKINLKVGLDGQSWPWHQDFTHWFEEDGLPEPRAVNVGIYLDAVTRFNGPLFIIPGSHRASKQPSVEQESIGWSAKYRADIKYTMDSEQVKRLIQKYGIQSTEGPPGSALFFDINVAHGSASNISPFDRWLLIITYNSVKNIPNLKHDPRPEFLVGRDFSPLQPLVWS